MNNQKRRNKSEVMLSLLVTAIASFSTVLTPVGRTTAIGGSSGTALADTTLTSASQDQQTDSFQASNSRQMLWGQPIPASPSLAQTSGNLCRRVNVSEGLAVRERPDLNAPRIGGVDFNTQVTLVQNSRNIQSPDGRIWIEISSPIKGYISPGFAQSEINLVPCSGSSIPPVSTTNSTASLCRQIDARISPEGLAIRADASMFSTLRGGVTPGTQVTLIPNYQLIVDKNGESRNWVEITSPVPGFVAADSLIMCHGEVAATPQTTPPVSNKNLCRQVEGRVAPEGLAIRADASRSSAYLGGVPVNGQVTLVSNYRLIPDKNGEPRNWIEITSPVGGFISADNLIMCR